MGFEPDFSVAAPATSPVVPRARIRLCRLPTGSLSFVVDEGGSGETYRVGRSPRLLRGRDRGGRRGSLAGPDRNDTRRLELFARSLDRKDEVALEVTGNAWEIARIIEPHVARVVVVSPSDTGIRQARAKTDRLDARALAKLLAIIRLDGNT